MEHVFSGVQRGDLSRLDLGYASTVWFEVSPKDSTAYYSLGVALIRSAQ